MIVVEDIKQNTSGVWECTYEVSPAPGKRFGWIGYLKEDPRGNPKLIASLRAQAEATYAINPEHVPSEMLASLAYESKAVDAIDPVRVTRVEVMAKAAEVAALEVSP
ncbi:hypothetical protein UFOVP1077_3 [uncultured Caudovirales phage]|uniref:Uncharacterized protein n=1 Tax=uncultured Caudovirales phage TaxID=2100421 RepID=A0A6J5QDS1_9CAUD|nr:hypothetical protein UFOVP1077_3 [uncultured Caudovirales phage]CAB4198044.1 hypothetical protein UFOVP1316_46 [uncultured Caudovirales phage]CAB4211456.1 hypothetical protein UFOVP1428_55 [uncultured Caudovirales phage]CAB5227450.1 hypothetical protein UFOVP1526_44 [uncultured Caudovirales phage]